MSESHDPNRPLEAVILAGKRESGKDPLDGLGLAHKSLLEIGGQPIISRVLSALKQSRRCDTVKLATSAPLQASFDLVRADMPGLEFLDVAPSPSRTIAMAMDQLADGHDLLVTTSDHALLTPQMITEFLDEIDPAAHAAAAACVDRETYMAAFADTPRTFIKLSDFAFSGANLFWFRGQDARPLIEFWRALEDNRKHPHKMATQIGLTAAALYLSGKLSRRGALARIEKKTGVAVTLVPLSDPKAAIDVDKPADIDAVEAILAKA